MKKVTEYFITFKDGEEFITEDKAEAEKEFESVDKATVNQYFRKDWVFQDGEYGEEYVEVYYG